MTVITPGIDFLAPYLVKLTVLSAFLALASKYLGIDFNLPIVVLTSVFGLLFISTAKVIWKSINDRQAAASLGARLMPVFDGKWIGNLDIMTFLIQQFEIGYPGVYSAGLHCVVGVSWYVCVARRGRHNRHDRSAWSCGESTCLVVRHVLYVLA